MNPVREYDDWWLMIDFMFRQRLSLILCEDQQKWKQHSAGRQLKQTSAVTKTTKNK